MSEWREVSVQDLCSRVTSGGTPSRKRSDFYGRNGIAWVKSQELVESRISATEEHITEAGLKGSSAKLLPPDTVLMAMYGANVGQLGWLGIEATVNQAICAMVTDPEVTDSRFLYYALAGARASLIAKAHGAAQQNLSQQLIKPFKLAVPDIKTQRLIGGMLRSIDDLIENNRRRVQVLEEMARAIYREWFVEFRYPGHEDVAFVDSALGPIPEGWACVPLGRVADLDRTGLQPGKFPTEMFDHYSLPAFDRDRLPALEVGAAIKSSKFVVSSPAVLVSKLNPRIDRTWYVEPRAALRSVTSTEFLVLRPTEPHKLAWLYLLATSQLFRDRLISLSGGTSTSHQRTKPQDFLEIEVVVAPESVSARLTDVAEPLLSDARALVKQGDLLARLRDLLLPKVVTGAVDISTLDLDAWVSTGSTGEGAVV